jgi:hypothetical protein
MNVRYRVTLTPDERESLEALVRGGKGAVRRLKRAQILLAADAGSAEENHCAERCGGNVDDLPSQPAAPPLLSPLPEPVRSSVAGY